MFQQRDLEDGTWFWDCPRLCIGAKPRKPKKCKALEQKTAPVIEIPVLGSPGPRMREASYEGRYDSEAFETPKKSSPSVDTNLASHGGLPQAHMLRFWKGPTCVCCDREADFLGDRYSRYCWVHGGPRDDHVRGDTERMRALLPLLVWLLLATVIVAGFKLSPVSLRDVLRWWRTNAKQADGR